MRAAWFAAVAGCAGLLYLATVRGSATGMFVSSVGAFLLIIIPVLRASGGRNI